MSALSGKDGEVGIGSSNPIDLVQWDLDHGANVETFAARSGGGAEETQEGLENGTGSFQFIMNTVTPITSLISKGDLVTLSLKHSVTPSVAWAGQARIGKFSSSVNRDGTMQRVTVNFTCHKTWTAPS